MDVSRLMNSRRHVSMQDTPACMGKRTLLHLEYLQPRTSNSTPQTPADAPVSDQT